ncbi:hypothetical protein [Stenotrophomonas sp. PS02289]|uniref:hypothetical protein n=1 Tax=Stenotrophomonas sp. PS02289 TaxID=2991422 RepID=UPI00249A6C9B|nr:hypothetical protein [Stenotrophomonas sp. PS02289]
MERGNWVAMRTYGPAAGLLLLAALVLSMLSSWPQNTLLAGLQSVVGWVPVCLVAASLGLMGMATYRLIQWERGAGHDCPNCGGPLGQERAGRARMGGAYRRCYACGSNVNHRHYE